MKKFKEYEIRKMLNYVSAGQMSFSRFVEFINERIVEESHPTTQVGVTDAIEFAEWINENGWIRDPFPVKEFNDDICRWSDIATVDAENNVPLKYRTTEQLYNEFKLTTPTK